MVEPIPVQHRADTFRASARNIIARYRIQKANHSDLLCCLRIAYLFSNELVKIYATPQIGQDAAIWFRDWAWNVKLSCDIISHREIRGGKKIANPYKSFSNTLYGYNFSKYTKILDELFAPPRTPLLRRTPVTWIQV